MWSWQLGDDHVRRVAAAPLLDLGGARRGDLTPPGPTCRLLPLLYILFNLMSHTNSVGDQSQPLYMLFVRCSERWTLTCKCSLFPIYLMCQCCLKCLHSVCFGLFASGCRCSGFWSLLASWLCQCWLSLEDAKHLKGSLKTHAVQNKHATNAYKLQHVLGVLSL